MQPADAPFPPLPKPVRYLIGGLSAVTLLSALAMAITAAVLPRHPVWVLTGFEAVIVAAGAIGLLGMNGRFDQGQGLYLTCIAGVLFVAGFLPFLGTRHGIAFGGGPPDTTLPFAWMLARLALASAFGLIAAYAVLRRSAQAAAFLYRALIAGVVLAALAAPFALARGMPSWLSPTGRPVMYAALAVYAIVALIGVCAFGHFVIRAFESGRTRE